jgi:hypothetical protein
MAVYERTFDEAIAQVEALTMGGFSSANQDRLGVIFNLAATRAKRKTDYWERLLIVDEPRTVSRGILQTSEDSFNVYGAGTDAANGLYVRNGNSIDGNPAYTLYDSDGTTSLYNLWSLLGFSWLITSSDIDNDAEKLYIVSSGSTTPPLTGWAVSGGESPAPLLKDVDDIETALYYRKESSTIRASRTYEFAADGYGIRPNATDQENEIVYVTYIKKLTDVYGNGESGTTSSIPAEWFDYMTLYAAYMYQSSQRQNNPNAAYGMALREVESSLEDEMMRLETQGIPQTVRQNVETRVSYSSIL